MEWEGLLIQVVYLVIVTFVPIIGLALRKMIMSQSMLADFLAKEELVAAGVEFVEQFYTEYKGQEKYLMALEWVSSQLEVKGITVDVQELQGLIEAAVYELNAGWNK